MNFHEVINSMVPMPRMGHWRLPSPRVTTREDWEQSLRSVNRERLLHIWSVAPLSITKVWVEGSCIGFDVDEATVMKSGE